jgi:hypothetical protein
MEEYSPQLPPESGAVPTWVYEELIRLSAIIKQLQQKLEEKT